MSKEEFRAAVLKEQEKRRKAANQVEFFEYVRDRCTRQKQQRQYYR